MNDFLDTLAEGLARWNQPLPPDRLEALGRYWELLLQANARMNLTAVTDSREAARRHFLDSLCPPALEALPPGARIIDVGTGAGFPGLPLAIARPDLRVTLADARKKRLDFLASVIGELSLPNASVLWSRAEDLGRQAAHREGYDAALARAVAALPTLCEYLLPLVRVGGVMLAWKGAAAPRELAAAAKALRLLGASESSPRPYAISHEFCQLSLLVCKKIRHTPPGFPRPSGKPAKDPLV